MLMDHKIQYYQDTNSSQIHHYIQHKSSQKSQQNFFFVEMDKLILKLYGNVKDLK